jgi:putative ABC transport system permease protein
MNILNKYLWRSITEKKGRMILLIMCISISVALLVGTLGATKSMTDSISDAYKNSYGDYNIGLSSNNRENPFFNTDDIMGVEFSNCIKILNAGGYLTKDDSKEVSIYGMSLEDFKAFKIMKLVENSEINNLSGNDIIISKQTSDEYKLKIGDEIKVTILGKAYTYKIRGISVNRGLFADEQKESCSIIVNKNMVSQIYGIRDKYTQVFINVNSKNLDKWINKFKLENKNKALNVYKLFDEEKAAEGISMVRNSMFIILAVVLLCTTFLIYNSFNLIVIERIPAIGTFLSQGSTRLKVAALLLKESFVYGIIGGVLGNLLGMVFIRVLANIGNPLKSMGVNAVVNYQIINFVIGFAFSIVLSVISALLPIVKIRKLPIKEVILNTMSVQSKNSFAAFIIGVALICIGFALKITDEAAAYKFSLIAIFSLIIGIIMVIPKLVQLVMLPIGNFIRNKNGLSVVAINNVRTSKLLLNNTRLMTISIIVMLMISTIATSFTNGVKDVYGKMDCNIIVTDNSNIPNLVYEKITSLKNVNKIYMSDRISDVNVNGDENKKILIEGITPSEWKGWNSYIRYDENEDKILERLNQDENGIIMCESTAKKNNLKEGDSLSINFNNNEVKLKIVGLLDSGMLGDFNLVNIKMVKNKLGLMYPNSYYIKTDNNGDELKQLLEKDLKGTGTAIITKSEMQEKNNKSMEPTINLLSVFAYIIFFIGGIGIASNIIMSFIQRKKDIAVISVIGLSKGQRGRLFLLEGLLQGLLSLCIGMISVFGLNTILSDYLKKIQLSLVLQYPVESIKVTFIAVMILMLITSITAVFKSRNLSIINEIRYE